jgi:hypothetical protein
MDMASAFGYSSVVLKPEFSNYTGCREYRQGRRRAFLCAKKTLLKELSAPTEPVSWTPTLRDLLWLVRDNAADVAYRLHKRSAAGGAERVRAVRPEGGSVAGRVGCGLQGVSSAGERLLDNQYL